MGRVIEQVLMETKLPILIVCPERTLDGERLLKPAVQAMPTN
jgi:hypothetical protein